MNYISLFSENELDIILVKIGGEIFKSLYIKYPKFFAKIKPGFRAKSISETMAVTIAKSNINEPFIQNCVNYHITNWITEINNNTASFEKDALAEALIDSVFIDNISVYFKCIGKDVDEVYLTALQDKVNNLKNERIKESESEKKVHELESAVAEVSQKLEQLQQEFAETCSEKDKNISELNKQLSEAQKTIKMLEFNSASNDPEITDHDMLLKYDDSKTVALPIPSDDSYVSVCAVSTSYSGEKRLIRCADIDSNGHLKLFCKNEDMPCLFGNRDKLFYKDGPIRDGVIGVWNWSAIINKSDASKDYVITKYDPNIMPIEIVVFPEFRSIGDLINGLKSGLSYKPNGGRVIFAVNRPKGSCEGVLCDRKDLLITSENTSFSELVTQLPVYGFKCDDVIRINDSISFYKKLAAGIPQKIYRIKSPLEIVKSAVLNSATWNNYKQYGIIKSDFQSFKKILSLIPTEDIINNICCMCYCGSQTAEQWLKQFTECAYKYIDGEYFEDKIIDAAISGNPKLMEKAKILAASEWRKENSDTVANAQEKISFLNEKIEKASWELSEANNQLMQVKQEKMALSAGIAEKEKLAADVESAVYDRIKRAQEKAADFIADMAFVGGSSLCIKPAGVSAAGPVAKYEVIECNTSPDDLEAHKNWSEVIDTLVYELEEAGVASKYSRGLAAYLCAAFIEKQPLLLAGPNAIDIVEAFGASLFGGKYGALNCEGNYSQDLINSFGVEGERIIAVKNFTESGWINKLPNIFSRKDIMFFAVHPYAEDVQVEPRSLYSYILPLFTEFFIDKPASGEYSGGFFDKGFKEYRQENTSKKEVKSLSGLTMTMITRNNIQKVIAVMHDLFPEASNDNDFMFAALQYAYAVMEINQLMEKNSPQNSSSFISSDLRHDLIAILGDLL